jgi:hypothetical protein
MIDLYIGKSLYRDRCPNAFLLAVCRECKCSWVTGESLDRALESIASHYCAHTIVSGPVEVQISEGKATATIGNVRQK